MLFTLNVTEKLFYCIGARPFFILGREFWSYNWTKIVWSCLLFAFYLFIKSSSLKFHAISIFRSRKKTLNEVGSWHEQSGNRSRPFRVIISKLFYIDIVIADANSYFQIQCVNIHRLNSFDNFLLFTRYILSCFLVNRGFSIRHFGFRRFSYRYT